LDLIMCIIRQRTYPASTAAISPARGFASASLSTALEPEGWQLADDAVLVVSELMTACIESDAARVDVLLEMHRDAIRIQVRGKRARRPVSALTGARARILGELTTQADFGAAGQDTVAVANLPCDRALTANLACRHHPVVA